MFNVGDEAFITTSVKDSPFNGKVGRITEVVGGGYMLYVCGLGEHFTTQRWLTPVEVQHESTAES